MLRFHIFFFTIIFSKRNKNATSFEYKEEERIKAIKNRMNDIKCDLHRFM